MEYPDDLTGPKEFVLCFDGTGNKFHGDESDSNVLKIFRMLDRSGVNQYHYYQPGIGTYVTSRSLSDAGTIQRIKSAYLKAKDSAVGSSFADHVMGGYKFLMRYYSPGDKIYFFGFSRGAYVARFLAEMLDYVGLLEMGNEELVRFAWKTFAKWQQRRTNSKDYQTEKQQLYSYMTAFRETFSRPVTQIEFLGLFDTVNSVPRFENAWMQRSKFPYTARTSAKVIRHAVGIDERRAKFRQDLISEVKPTGVGHHKSRLRRHFERHHLHMHHHHETRPGAGDQNASLEYSVYRPSRPKRRRDMRDDRRHAHQEQATSRGTSRHSGDETEKSAQSVSADESASDAGEEEGDLPQDIEEVWFPGCHADIGGGWKLDDGESWALSHAPLVWMVQEAQAAGLQFNPAKMRQFNCMPDEPIAQVDDPTQQSHRGSSSSTDSRFHQALRRSSTDGKIHDCLQLGQGLPATSVLSWKLMEWLPFRRMDLQGDGSWKPIRWPLPRGEVRDIPPDAQIHVSAIRRMQANEDYRPGNLILGGGGRGVRKAPKDRGMGEWDVLKHAGCPVRETYLRRDVANTGVSVH
ncbi:hypothetical protein ATEIFO6365_0006040100 [Aspergillus terreus]|uniref:T6SS Phospholipase effector Tle1-like catalytic domain-containing protein n=1 Tax=Aspergillus terreus TaxID=33178 RepID=A0A5M3YWT7_ASPTE|nr:hypothetical protein ATETN484_0005039900 [Aspergillus terreus]GFF17064.1 hypothetical protein ATEIFO6365_0006040100 [Aspergillus terreus]